MGKVNKGRINHSELLGIVNYNPESGIMTWSAKVAGWSVVGDEVGYLEKQGYRVVGIMGKVYRVHRLCWFYVYGAWPDEIDHISGERCDNRMKNLRSVGRKENTKNTKLRCSNTSGFNGVSWDKSRDLWVANVDVDGKRIFIGRFKNKSD